eukprot:TRINITY_DN1650_c0_g1_i1.p1 TRINITY_DN1650_c0_g1~~TRINITY_DN1650_c0_g1_i1.p1  ORF type:complete len:238 (-),score=84.22 TRINITY_DN1650_c0_g1_i1:285-998(-)
MAFQVQVPSSGAKAKPAAAKADVVKDDICGAAINNNLESLERFLSQGQQTQNKNLALRKAAEYGHVQIVDRMLREPDVDPCHMNNITLETALQKGHAAVVERLDADPRVQISPNAIVKAAEAGHTELVTYLSNTADVPTKYRALVGASSNGHAGVVDVLLKSRGVDTASQEAHTALFEASDRGHSEVVSRFLQENGLNTQDAWMRASEKGHHGVAMMLRDYQNRGFARKSASSCLVM